MILFGAQQRIICWHLSYNGRSTNNMHLVLKYGTYYLTAIYCAMNVIITHITGELHYIYIYSILSATLLDPGNLPYILFEFYYSNK